jgi:hypothetical protein
VAASGRLRLAPREWWPLGYLYDIGLLVMCGCTELTPSRAIGRTFDATAEHDGRIVADIIAEWPTTHTNPFTLMLTGPAGGTYRREPASAADRIEIEAIDCCRIRSGRRTPVGSSTTHSSCSADSGQEANPSSTKLTGFNAMPNHDEARHPIPSPSELMIRRRSPEQQNLAAIDEIAAEDYVELDLPPGQAPGREGLKPFLATVLFPAFPDQRWVTEEQIAEGDKVVSRFTMYGTHRGDFMGIRATGRSIAVKGVVIRANGRTAAS